MNALLLVAATLSIQAAPVQKPIELPFAKEVAAFKAIDQKTSPAKGQILFIGSSTFTIWQDAQAFFPSHKILNRAFGGSRLLDQMNFVNDVVFPYEPKQIVIYCGENDLGGEPNLPAYKVLERFEKLYGLLRARLPKTPIAYVSMKPSPSRFHLASKFIAANRWIREFCEKQPSTEFIDTWSAMLDASGRPRQELFTKDDLHMNAYGYRLWAPIIEPHLK
jgi:hypothetical protein